MTKTTREASVVLWAILMALAPAGAAAQAFDAGLPDASVGVGGPDQTSEENDPNAALCLDSRSCDNGFVCTNGRCVPTAKRNATGCATAPASALLAAAWVVVLGRRRSRRDQQCGL